MVGNRKLRSLVTVLGGIAALAAFAPAPAAAHDDYRGWRHHHQHREWRRDRPVVIYEPPPRVIYRQPPPAYYVPQYRSRPAELNLIFPFRF